MTLRDRLEYNGRRCSRDLVGDGYGNLLLSSFVMITKMHVLCGDASYVRAVKLH